MKDPMWVHQRVIMGCVLLTVEDRETGRRADRGYAETTNPYEQNKRYVMAVDAGLHAVGRPCPWQHAAWHRARWSA